MLQRYIRSLSINWNKVAENSYIHNIVAIRNTHSLLFDQNITFFVGNNGSGKSTLLEAIASAYGFNQEGGTLHYRFSTYEEHTALAEAVTLVKGVRRARYGYFLRAESFFNVATKALSYEVIYGDRSLHAQSHGESFLAFISSFDQEGLYLLDEPEAALSPANQLQLLIHMHQLASRGAQFFVASHSPILLGLPGARLYTFDGDTIATCDYTDTSSYQVTEMFINHRHTMLKELLAP